MPDLRHTFVSTRPQGADATKVRRNDWNAAHIITMPAQTLAGRIAGGTGPVQNIPIGDNLVLENGSLRVEGSLVVPECDEAVIRADVQRAMREQNYPTWTLGGSDDEFDDENFSGWTTVQDSSPLASVVEGCDRVSIQLPGGESAGELHAFMKAVTPSANAYIETAFRIMGRNQNYNIGGLIFSNGTTYGAGSQVYLGYSPSEASWVRTSFTNFNTNAGTTLIGAQGNPVGTFIFLRFQYLGSNNWRGWVSANGLAWIDITGSFARTLTPTHMGIFCTTWNATGPCQFSFEYFKYVP